MSADSHLIRGYASIRLPLWVTCGHREGMYRPHLTFLVTQVSQPWLRFDLAGRTVGIGVGYCQNVSNVRCIDYLEEGAVYRIYILYTASPNTASRTVRTVMDI